MRLSLLMFVLISLTAVNAQFGFIRNLLFGRNSGRPSRPRPNFSSSGIFNPFGFGNTNSGGGSVRAPKEFMDNQFVDNGTPEPKATGKDELFPTDCGRDPKTGTGKLCFPVGQICADRK